MLNISPRHHVTVSVGAVQVVSCSCFAVRVTVQRGLSSRREHVCSSQLFYCVKLILISSLHRFNPAHIPGLSVLDVHFSQCDTVSLFS